MNVSTITEAGAELIYRGLKLAEADIIKFRTSAEGRGYKHTVEECNEQLQLLRGNGAAPGLFAQFAPQLDAFEAGKLDGKGEQSEDGQLALADNGDEAHGTLVELDDPEAGAGSVSEDDVPVNSELEQGTATDGLIRGEGLKPPRAARKAKVATATGERKIKVPSKPRGRPRGSKTTKKR